MPGAQRTKAGDAAGRGMSVNQWVTTTLRQILGVR